MFADAEATTATEPMTDDSPGREVDAAPDGKAEGGAEGEAAVEAELIRSRQSIEAIGLMAENLRVLLTSKGSG